MMMISLVFLQDIQQHVPPWLLELMFERPKKSKSSLVGPKHSKGDQNPSKRTNPNYRYALNKVVEAIKSLTEPQKVKIKDYPFGSLLDLKLKGFESTKLLVFHMDSLDPDTLNLDIGIGLSAV